jgi:hypothetical protein
MPKRRVFLEGSGGGGGGSDAVSVPAPRDRRPASCKYFMIKAPLANFNISVEHGVWVIQRSHIIVLQSWPLTVICNSGHPQAQFRDTGRCIQKVAPSSCLSCVVPLRT